MQGHEIKPHKVRAFIKENTETKLKIQIILLGCLAIRHKFIKL